MSANAAQQHVCDRLLGDSEDPCWAALLQGVFDSLNAFTRKNATTRLAAIGTVKGLASQLSGLLRFLSGVELVSLSPCTQPALSPFCHPALLRSYAGLWPTGPVREQGKGARHWLRAGQQPDHLPTQRPARPCGFPTRQRHSRCSTTGRACWRLRRCVCLKPGREPPTPSGGSRDQRCSRFPSVLQRLCGNSLVLRPRL